MFDVRELNVAIELWGVAFCAVGIVCTWLFAPSEGPYRRVVAEMFLMELIAMGGDALAGVYRGRPGEVAWAATHIGNFSTFAANYVLLALATQYMSCRFEEIGDDRPRTWNIIVWVLAAVMSLCTAVGAFYHINQENLYERTSLYWVTYGYALLICVTNTVLILRRRARLGASPTALLVIYMLIPIITMGIQVLVYGLNFLGIGEVIGSVLLFLETRARSARLLAERTEELAQSRVEVAESRIAVMVSQIQPHFLFNTLDSIYYLCSEDPTRAQQAVDGFSTFLRANLDSLTKMAPVPIETELSHVRTYLELEKLSMEDLLEWEMDTPVGGFLVPALSLQTLVENAVKHGVSKKVGGGRVIIRTSDDEGFWRASVEDDGVGFDADASFGEGHVGLENTRMRLATMCGGTLRVTSEPGQGTMAVISIPKEAVR